ncbi:kinase-like domain-containing protein [Dactylonectria estremocensis]|uniref:Kinase-like domain-containing protein n=1 Tax=Dactylonectria estremocensis TaxID=1079267 RepID=A0A9P9ERS2_9HYPO|nr:kinase-like domain-containing protein [Dactylonectria estremocensis]
MHPLGPIRSDIVDRIRQCCEQESQDPPIPKKYGDIPVSYESITSEWLTATLVTQTTDTIVKSFRLGPKDDGSSNRRRIQLEWDGIDADKMPTSVFCKAAHALENRIMLSNAGTYSEAYFAGYDPTSWASMIMLKDMGDAATFCTHKTTLTKTQFAEQIQSLARLHGKFYQSNNPFFEQLVGYKDRFENLIASLDIEKVCGNGFKAAKSVVPPRLFARKDEIWPATVQSVAHNASLPQTVVHGDVHLGNWYIKANSHMGLTDWQAMSRGHWSRDLAYVLGTGIPTETRRLWEHEMVQLYVSEFEKACGPRTSVQEAWLQLRRQSFGALWYWTFTLTPSRIMPDMQSEETTLDFIGRICTLIDDHAALDAFD